MKFHHLIAWGSLAVSVLAAPLQTSAATITNYAYVRAQQQLCGPGPSPHCITSVAYADTSTQSSMQGQGLDLSIAPGSGLTPAGVMAATAAANLPEGSVKGSALALGVVPGSHVYSAMQSRIGDTYTLAAPDGTPYTGTGLSSFHLDISGGVLATGSPSLMIGVSIGIYQPGFFDRFWSGDYEGAYSMQIDSKSINFDAASTFPASLDFSFAAPTSSFEWDITLFAIGQFDQDEASGHSFIVDLGHTVKGSFSGPDGTLLSSASGYLLPTAAAAVPEPSRAMLALLGLTVCLAAFRRARKQAPAEHASPYVSSYAAPHASPSIQRAASHARGLLAFSLLAPLLATADPNYSASSTSAAYVFSVPDNAIVSSWTSHQFSSSNNGLGQSSASTQNLGGELDGRSVSSTAASSLADASLRVSAYASGSASEHGYLGIAAGSAYLGDRFIAGSGTSGAFSWTPDSQAQFIIQLDGTSFNSSADNQLMFDLELSIRSLDGSASASSIFYGNLRANGEVTVQSEVGADTTMVFSQHWGYSLVTGAYTLFALFQPNGDFDWNISLSTSARVNNDFETVSNDYSHTAHVSYYAPEGSTTYSDSGVFPGTLAGLPSTVPEPASWALVLCGLAGLATWRKARRGNTRH